MNREELQQLLVDRAIGALEYDDAHPNVGMGMSYITAVRDAKKIVEEESILWGVPVEVDESLIKEVSEIVYLKRGSMR